MLNILLSVHKKPKTTLATHDNHRNSHELSKLRWLLVTCMNNATNTTMQEPKLKRYFLMQCKEGVAYVLHTL